MGERRGFSVGNKAVTVLLFVSLALIWGSTWLFIKVGLADLPPFGFAGVRFVLAAVPLWGYMAARRPKGPSTPGEWILVLGVGLLTISAGYGLVFWGEQHISSGLTAILFTSYGLFGLLFAHLFVPEEPLAPRKIGGVFTGIAGIGLIFSDQLAWHGGMAAWGCAAVILAAVVQAFCTVMIKTRAGHMEPIAVTAWQMAIGAVPLLLLGLLFEGNPLRFRWTPMALFSMVYLALVGSSLAFVLWYTLLKRVQVTKAQTMPLLNTLVAVVLGFLFLDERFGIREASGGLAILLGTALVITAPKAPPPRGASAPP
jgi:drug/metabolite transporter (DMT)-like permease